VLKVVSLPFKSTYLWTNVLTSLVQRFKTKHSNICRTIRSTQMHELKNNEHINVAHTTANISILISYQNHHKHHLNITALHEHDTYSSGTSHYHTDISYGKYTCVNVYFVNNTIHTNKPDDISTHNFTNTPNCKGCLIMQSSMQSLPITLVVQI